MSGSLKFHASTVYLLLFAAITGVLVALSPYYDTLNADTAVAYMNGMVRWTPFFWGQDRYGMLVPALTAAITDPAVNIVAQNAIHVFFSVASFFLLARFLFPGSRAMSIGLLSWAAYFILNGLPEIKDFLTPWQIYTPAMAFGLGGVLLARRHWWLALPLLLVAEWCNFTVSVWLGILTVARGLEEFGRREDHSRMVRHWSRVGLLLVTSSAFGLWLKSHFPPPQVSYGILPSWDSLHGWIRLLIDYWSYLPRTTWWLPLAPAAFGVTALAISARDGFRSPHQRNLALRSWAVGVTSAIFYAMVVGASAFAKFNSYHHRYLIPAFMIWTVSWVGLTVQVLPSFRIAVQGGFRHVLPLLLLALPIGRLGPPSWSGVRESLARRFEPLYESIPKSCTHVAGDYYRVWDSVFYSRLRTDSAPLWPITYRSSVIADLWNLRRFQGARVCYWRDNEDEAHRLLSSYGVRNFVQRTQSGNIVELPVNPPDIAGTED